MKKTSYLTLLAIFLFVLGVLLFISSNLNGFITNKQLTTQGVIGDINISNKRVEIINQNNQISFLVDNQTIITDESGQTIPFNQLKKGLNSQAKGNIFLKEKTLAKAREIKLLKSPNIIIYNPILGETVNSKFQLSGIAQVFENTFIFRLKNIRTNKTYAQSATETNATDMGQYGDFDFEVNFLGNAPDIKDGDNLLLEVFQLSPKDGSETDKTSVMIKYEAPAASPSASPQ